MAVRPQHNPIIVIRLGIIRLNDGPLYRGRSRLRGERAPMDSYLNIMEEKMF